MYIPSQSNYGDIGLTSDERQREGNCNCSEHLGNLLYARECIFGKSPSVGPQSLHH